MIIKFLLVFFICFIKISTAFAGIEVEAVYPYSLEKKANNTVLCGRTVPFYLNIKSFDEKEQVVTVKIILPDGFAALDNDIWHQENNNTVSTNWVLPADYGQTFDLFYIKPGADIASGNKNIKVIVEGKKWNIEKNVSFVYDSAKVENNIAGDADKIVDENKFNWYIQEIRLPVDNLGKKDDRTADNVIFIPDTSLESFRSRMTGDGATNWSAVYNHPATYLLLDMRNPQQDIRLLKFKAELIDKNSGKVVSGLSSASRSNDESEQGWAGETGTNEATNALLSLDGQKVQSFILPLYIDYLKIIEGSYILRITVSGNGQERIQEVPIIIEQTHSIGIIAVISAIICFIFLLLRFKELYKCINNIGAKGTITVSLFAAVAFGGIVIPTTVFGEILHVFLGPFSGFVTGILSGILQYLLIMALLVLYRQPGVVGLMFIIKFMLSGLLFGNFTPIGFLSCAVYIVFLESVMKITGLYNKKELTVKYIFFVASIIGITDAVITFINLEQIMFFYRLYYADWYLALYMLINGFLYSGIGCWLGYKIGLKLEQVTGE